MISSQALNDFKEIWKDEVKTSITDEQALERSIHLLELFNIIYKSLKKDEVEDLL